METALITLLKCAQSPFQASDSLSSQYVSLSHTQNQEQDLKCGALTPHPPRFTREGACNQDLCFVHRCPRASGTEGV